MKDSVGNKGFRHEIYFMGGAMEAIYNDVPKAIALQVFAPAMAARGSSFSANRRAHRTGTELSQPEGTSEAELY
jgi:hypothetical protein